MNISVNVGAKSLTTRQVLGAGAIYTFTVTGLFNVSNTKPPAGPAAGYVAVQQTGNAGANWEEVQEYQDGGLFSSPTHFAGVANATRVKNTTGGATVSIVGVYW